MYGGGAGRGRGGASAPPRKRQRGLAVGGATAGGVGRRGPHPGMRAAEAKSSTFPQASLFFFQDCEDEAAWTMSVEWRKRIPKKEQIWGGKEKQIFSFTQGAPVVLREAGLERSALATCSPLLLL